MEYTALELAYFVAAALVTATLHSVGGFAGALLLAIALAPVLGVKETVPVVATAMMISHASRVWLFRKTVDWGAFWLLFCFGLPFIVLGVLFTVLQAYEYSYLLYKGWEFGGDKFFSNFFMATGFHGAHVIIGTIFLFVCLLRVGRGHFTAEKHIGFEAAAWYWHFVDVVWLFLFAAVYIWGG